MPRIDVLIRGGLVFDGGGADPFLADVAIEGDRIASIGSFPDIRASMVIEADGLAVAPGFIDAHAHSDFTILADPRAQGKVSQGVTTEINGNCGLSGAPLLGKALERREMDLVELGIGERWKDLGEYFRLIESRGTAVNIATLVGQGNIRGSVVGYEDRSPSERDMSAMESLLQESIGEGAIGLSTGLVYPPGLYTTTEELIGLARHLSARDLIYATHMRSEGDELLGAVAETIRIGREAGVAVHISHLKTSGERNWHKAADVIAMIEKATKGGLRITCDRYPYTASSTDLDAILPAWAFEGGNDEEMRRLREPSTRERLRREVSGAAAEGYWERVIISSVVSAERRWMEGRSIAEIARMRGMAPVDTVLDVIADENLRVGAIFHSMSEANLMRFLTLPYCMIGSDSSARSFDGITRSGKPHPRTFGTFPRFIGRFAREKRLLGLPEAVHKVTALPARAFGLAGRGKISEGMHADLVIFDAGAILDRATFDDPFLRSEGIHSVLVNGSPVLLEGEFTDALPGRVLRRSR